MDQHQGHGRLGTEHSYVVLAVAAGVAVGSVLSGLAWSAKRRILAGLLVVCITSGEMFALAQTAQRLVTASEAQQAPLREHAEAHAAAVKRLTDAQAAVGALPTTSPRLDKAEAAKKAADAAVVGKAAEMGCRRECRALLDKAVDDAGAEVAAARAELSASGAKARGELEAARVALAGMTAPASATPLADRLGLPGWVLDLATAALGSIAANGLAACLLLFASHAPPAKRQPRQRRPVAGKSALEAVEGAAEGEARLQTRKAARQEHQGGPARQQPARPAPAAVRPPALGHVLNCDGAACPRPCPRSMYRE